MLKHFAVYKLYLRYAVVVEMGIECHELPSLNSQCLNKLQINGGGIMCLSTFKCTQKITYTFSNHCKKNEIKYKGLILWKQ